MMALVKKIGVIMDFDNTLTKGFDEEVRGLEKTSEELGLVVPEKKAFVAFWGLPWPIMFSRLWPGVDIKRFEKKLTELCPEEPIELMEGSRETLVWLKEKKFVTCLVTNRERETLFGLLGKFGIKEEIFEIIQTLEDFVFSKPDPWVLANVLEHLRTLWIAEEEVIFVGDSVIDYETAKKAEIEFVGVLSGPITTREEWAALGLPAQNVISSIEELPEFIERRNRSDEDRRE